MKTITSLAISVGIVVAGLWVYSKYIAPMGDNG